MARVSASVENINHFHGVRLRVTGSGNLKLKLLTLDSVRTLNLESLVMSVTTEIEPTRICNFMTQRAQLEIKTTEINETFSIGKIIVFAKPVFTSYPG